MKKIIFIYLSFLINIHIFAIEPKNNISVKQMLLSGPSEIKLHSLAMITQGKINDKLDDTYIEAFEVCSMDKYVPVRMTTAKILGKSSFINISTFDLGLRLAAQLIIKFTSKN